MLGNTESGDKDLQGSTSQAVLGAMPVKGLGPRVLLEYSGVDSWET